jgi:ketosteroid isomerase-like protein
MSENLDLMRSIFSAIEHGDYTNANWADPEIEYVIVGGPEPGTLRGRAGLAEAMRTIFREVEDVRAEVEQYRELDAEHVLVLTRNLGRGKRSGVPVSARNAEVFEIHEGKVTRIVFYYERNRALADVGLDESAVSQESDTPDLEERLQRFVDAINARDFDAAVSIYAHDATFHSRVTVVGVLEGRAAIRGFFEEWFGVYEAFEFELEELRDLGHGVTFAIVVLRGKPRGSTGWVHLRYASVGNWVDGLVERSTEYLDIDEARAAAERLAQERR